MSSPRPRDGAPGSWCRTVVVSDREAGERRGRRRRSRAPTSRRPRRCAVDRVEPLGRGGLGQPRPGPGRRRTGADAGHRTPTPAPAAALASRRAVPGGASRAGSGDRGGPGTGGGRRPRGAAVAPRGSSPGRRAQGRPRGGARAGPGVEAPKGERRRRRTGLRPCAHRRMGSMQARFRSDLHRVCTESPHRHAGTMVLTLISVRDVAVKGRSPDMDEPSGWRTGNCRNYPPPTFFPSDGVGVEVARQICAECPVQEPCLEYALAEPHRSRRVGWLLRAGASPHPKRRRAPTAQRPIDPADSRRRSALQLPGPPAGCAPERVRTAAAADQPVAPACRRVRRPAACCRRSAGGSSRRRAAAAEAVAPWLVVVDALLELVLRLAERPGQLGQLRAAEEDEHDHQDDDELR